MSDVYSSTAKKTFFCSFSVLRYHTWNISETNGSGNKSGVFLWGSVSPSKWNEIQVAWQEDPGHKYKRVGRRLLFSLAKIARKSLFFFFCVFSFIGLMFNFYLKITNKVQGDYICDVIIKHIYAEENVILGCVSMSLRKEQFDAWGKGFDERKKPGLDC